MPQPKKKDQQVPKKPGTEGRGKDLTQTMKDLVARAAKSAAQADGSIDIVTDTLERAKATGLGFQKQRESLAKDLAKSAFFQVQQQKFFTSIFPIAGKVLECASDLFNSKHINETQRNQLAGIGQAIVNIPAKMLSGEMDLKKGFSSFVGAIKSLGNFMLENKDVALKIGGPILQSMHPLGSFIVKAVEEVSKSDVSSYLKIGMLKGLSILADCFKGFESKLAKAAENKANIKHD